MIWGGHRKAESKRMMKVVRILQHPYTKRSKVETS